MSQVATKNNKASHPGVRLPGKSVDEEGGLYAESCKDSSDDGV